MRSMRAMFVTRMEMAFGSEHVEYARLQDLNQVQDDPVTRAINYKKVV